MKKGWRGEGGEEKNVEKHTKSVRKTKFFLKKKNHVPRNWPIRKREIWNLHFFFLLPMKKAKFTLSDWSVLITSKCSNLIGSIMHKLSRKRKQLGNRENE